MDCNNLWEMKMKVKMNDIDKNEMIEALIFVL